MVCTSGSVQKVADKTKDAQDQVNKLQNLLKSEDGKLHDEFFARIDQHLKDASITDARQLSYNSDIKTEYTSEFSLDKIAGVVTAALKAVAAAKDPSVVNPAMSPEAIQSYTDLVNTVAEAAKSSSTASADLSFSMNRLSPGILAFLYASSTTIQDKDTFGSEAVTSTAIYYRLVESIQDVKSEEKFNAALIDSQNLLHMKTLQAGLTDRLATGEITIETWQTLDAKYSDAVAVIQKRLDADKLPRVQLPQAPKLSATSRAVVSSAIQRLASVGDTHQAAVEVSQKRLAANYY